MLMSHGMRSICSSQLSVLLTFYDYPVCIHIFNHAGFFCYYRVVDDLLAIPGKPRLGALPLLSAPEPVPAGAVPILIDEVLRLPGRLLPVIVCTQPDRDDDAWLERAHRIAERTRGFANVFTLGRSAAGALRARLGGLAVHNGCMRIYSQAPLNPGSNGLRHRCFPLDRFQPSPEVGVERVVAGAAALSTRLPTPPGPP